MLRRWSQCAEEQIGRDVDLHDLRAPLPRAKTDNAVALPSEPALALVTCTAAFLREIQPANIVRPLCRPPTMISSPTVLVLGAGASRPYGFPTAAELKELICGRFQEGSEACRLFDERSEFYTTYNFVEFRNAFRKSGKASVDAFLEHRPEFIDVGKLAIAYCLRPFEREDSLFDANAIGSSDWYQYLFERLSTTFDEFRQNKLAIITFNYDRSLEHYLLVALRNTYGRDIDECIDVLRAIPIVHVYGQLSRHPYPFDKGSLAYRTGGDEYFAAVNAAAGISLLHEAEPALDQAKALLDGAERVCFLGFGYHPQTSSGCVC